MNIVKKIHLFYKSYVELLLPLWGATAVSILVVGRIPYVNLYSTEFITIIVVINWFVLEVLCKFSFERKMSIVLFLFGSMYILHFMKMIFYAEVVANTVYIILMITLMRELFSGAQRNENK